MTAVASRAPVAAGRAAASGPEAAERSAAVLGPLWVAAERAPVLDRVPEPVSDDPVVMLGGQLAGGLEAVAARWGPGGGSVVLSGRRAFLDVTGSAGFGPDGVLDGRVELRADLQVLGLPLGSATWVVHGWEPSAELALPTAEIRGTVLRVDLAALPPEVTLTASAGIAATTTDGGVTLELPGDAVPLGEPISPRIAELYRGLLGVDLSSLVGTGEAALLDREIPPAGGVGAAVPVVDPPVPGAAADAGGAGAGGGAASAGEAAAGGAPTASEVGVPGTQDGAAGEGVGESAGEAVAPEAVAAEPGAGAEGGGAAPIAPVLMPEAPTAPGPAAAARAGAVAGGAGGAARAARELPSADQNTADARGAVTEPVAETAARAREELAAELGERPAPSPEIVELVQRIRDAIRNNRPEDEDQLLATDPTQEAQSAGETVSGTVDAQVSEASGEYDAMSTPPAGSPALSPTPVATPPAASAGMGVDAASAAPDPLPPQNTSLDADVAATDQRIADAGMETRVTAEIPDGPIGDARAARGELGELAQRTPAEIAAEEQVAIDSAQADMARLQQEAVAALRAARTGTIGGVAERQEGMTGQEEVTRENVSQRAQAIYDAAERQVTGLLTPLGRTAMGRWEAGLARHSREFHDCLDRVQRWIEERHSGVVGTIVAVGDYIAGLPSWVTDEYNRAENQFGNDIGELLLDISSEANGVIAAAQAIIVRARTDIGALFDQMEAEFPEFAAAERARFEGLLDGLSQQATAAQTSFVREVSRAAVTAVNEAHAAVEARRLEAGGLIGAVVRAIEEFIEDPARAIINGLLRLVNIPPAAFWALIAQIESVVSDIAANPEGFLNNLVAGVKQGFSQFFDNFGTHLLGAFWRWLFSGLKTPIPMPTSFDAPALFSFALQLMGITWPNVREILVRHLGPTAVDVIEAAWELISVLVARGPEGLVDLVKEQLAPENIVGMILDAAIEYLVETLVVQAAQYIFSLLNPAGALAQAVRLIYVVCSWIFRNAARIFAFVQAVVGGIANVISGNISGLAGVVERALASMMVVAIDFIAGLLSLGALPDEVAAVIVRMQTYVLGIVERIVVFLVTRARALLARLGLGSENPEDGGEGNEDDELGTTVRFSAGGESHRVFFQVSGDEATLMLASTPAPIEVKIAEWRGMLSSGQPADEAARAEATTTLGNLESVANEANADGDRLARLFLEAARSQGDTIDPPSDNDLENRQRAIAGMLDRLFTLFGQQDEGEIVEKVRAAMPGHVGDRVNGARIAFDRDLVRSTYLPQNSDTQVPVWSGDTMATAARAAAVAVGARPDVHLALVPWFRDNSQPPSAAATGAFADWALVRRGTSHGVGSRVTAAYGEAFATALRAGVPTDLDPIDTQLRQAITTVSWSASATGFGRLAGLPHQAGDADPPLVAATAGGVLPFLRGMSGAGEHAGYRWPRLLWAWGHRPSRNHLKDGFRALSAGTHEWIPTSMIPEVVERAIAARGMAPSGVREGLQWINLFHHLRTDTRRVYYRVQNPPVYAPGRPPLYAAGAGLHSGAAYRDETGNRGAGLMGQQGFHDALRDEFRRYPLTTPTNYIQSLLWVVADQIWDGQLASTAVPEPVWDQPIGYWFRLVGGAARVSSITLRDLAALQEANIVQIDNDFTNARNRLDET